MATHTLEIEIETDQELTEAEVSSLESVIEHGSVGAALRTKVPSATIKDTRVDNSGPDFVLEDVEANPKVMGKGAEDADAAEPFRGVVAEDASGPDEHQVLLLFKRDQEPHDRSILIEQQGDTLSVLLSSEHGLDADAVVEIGKESTTMKSNRARRDGRTFDGTEFLP